VEGSSHSKATNAIAELRELVSILHPGANGNKWLAMLRLYLDDAGSQDNIAKPFFAVGGYIAPAQTWESFSVAWQKVLDEMHAPPYHATDCESDATGYGHGDFKTWSTEKLLELKKKLAPLTHQLSAGVGRGLNVPDHNEQLLNDPYFRNRVDGAKNYLPLFLVLEAALDWIASAWPHRPQGEKISVVFESGTKGVALAAVCLCCFANRCNGQLKHTPKRWA